MKIFQSFLLVLWMAISMVHATDEKLMIPSDDIKFQVFKYQPESLVEPIGESEPSSVKLDHHLKAVSKAVDALSTVLSTILKADIKSDARVQSTRSTPKAIAYEILHSREINNEFRLQALVKSLQSAIENSNSESYVLDVEKILTELVDTFFYGESPFYRYPALAIPTLVSLASFVETFAETLIAQNHQLAKTTLVPCDLAETIFQYFKPTLIDRFNEIEITSDYERFLTYNKFVFSEKIANQPFIYDRVEGFVRCLQGDGGKTEYEMIKSKFGGGKFEVPKVAFMAPSLFIEEVNRERVHYSLLKDNLGNEDDFYFSKEITYEPCARDYFSLVRQRLESELEQARNKVSRVCQVDLRKRHRTPTGFGWLSVKVGSLLAEHLENGQSCVTTTNVGTSTMFNAFCDPYVKVTAKFELNGRRLKVEHQTEVKGHAVGWTPVEETFHFDKIPKNATIDIEILNADEQRIFGETTTIPLLVNRILLENSNSKLFLTSTWRDEAK